MGVCKPGELLDPSNRLLGPEKWNDLLGSGDTTDGKNGCPIQRLVDGACGPAGPGPTFGGTTAGSAARADYLVRNFIEKGYNTNYAASWYLVRSALKYETGTVFSPGPPPSGFVFKTGSGNAKGLDQTRGPLTMRQLESATVSTSLIPLLGCGAPGDPDEAVLSVDLKNDPTTTIYTVDPNEEIVMHMEAGERLVEAFNDGPATYREGVGIVLIPGGTDVTNQMVGENSPAGPPPPVDTGSPETTGWLQDTRDWYAVHGGGVNILFADGSVKSFTDRNGDMYLNPGFPIPKGLDEATYERIGYRSNTVELPPAEIYSGVFLQNDAHKPIPLETSF
jgi:prepilin-type processing-associated H-X9-DG protein